MNFCKNILRRDSGAIVTIGYARCVNRIAEIIIANQVPIKVNKIRFTAVEDTGWHIHDAAAEPFKILGSNDGKTWDTILSFNRDVNCISEWIQTVNASKAYKKIKVWSNIPYWSYQGLLVCEITDFSRGGG